MKQKTLDSCGKKSKARDPAGKVEDALMLPAESECMWAQWNGLFFATAVLKMVICYCSSSEVNSFSYVPASSYKYVQNTIKENLLIIPLNNCQVSYFFFCFRMLICYNSVHRSIVKNDFPIKAFLVSQFQM